MCFVQLPVNPSSHKNFQGEVETENTSATSPFFFFLLLKTLNSPVFYSNTNFREFSAILVLQVILDVWQRLPSIFN
jgi:hypothetical protein